MTHTQLSFFSQIFVSSASGTCIHVHSAKPQKSGAVKFLCPEYRTYYFKYMLQR